MWAGGGGGGGMLRVVACPTGVVLRSELDKASKKLGELQAGEQLLVQQLVRTLSGSERAKVRVRAPNPLADTVCWATATTSTGEPLLAVVPDEPKAKKKVHKPPPAASKQKGGGAQVCLAPFWKEHTQLRTYFDDFNSAFAASPALAAACRDDRQARRIIGACAKQLKGNSGQAARCLTELYHSRPSGAKAHVALAALLLLKFDGIDGIAGAVQQIEERIYRCESAKKQAYAVVCQLGHEAACRQSQQRKTPWDKVLPALAWNRAAQRAPSPAAEQLAATGGTAELMEALAHVERCAAVYLDGHKEAAFKSALHEPARFYFHLCGNAHHRDHVNVVR